MQFQFGLRISENRTVTDADTDTVADNWLTGAYHFSVMRRANLPPRETSTFNEALNFVGTRRLQAIVGPIRTGGIFASLTFAISDEWRSLPV